MSRKAKWTAVRLTTEAVAVLLIAVYVVANYEQRIAAINWRLVSLICAIAGAVFGIYRWQMREDNTYDVLDMVMEAGRADLNAHFQIASFGLATWLIVQQALAHQPVTELMLGVLTVFVVKKAAQGFSDAMQNRPPPVDRGDVRILEGAKVDTDHSKDGAPEHDRTGFKGK